MAEKKAFVQHENLLLTTIKRQAGTLKQAIEEAIQNSADAGATTVDVVITADTVMITDNGKGISDRATLERCFGVFGQPHEESEAKQFGAFRMGRGQLFCFGRNVWRTCNFQMVIDIDEHLGYDLHDDCEFVQGCSICINLSNHLSEADLARTLADLRRDTKWMRIKVVVNENQFSTNPEEANWRYKTGWYYFHPNRTGVLRVYNLGLLVREFANDRLRVGGDMVSTVPLQLNTARTDIMDGCPVWREFKNSLEAVRATLDDESNAEMERLLPKKKKARSSKPREKREGESLIPYIALRHRHAKACRLAAMLAEAKKVAEGEGMLEGAVMDHLVALAREKEPYFDRLPILMVQYERKKEAAWTTLNGLWKNTVNCGRKVVFAEPGDRSYQLATRSKLAAAVQKTAVFDSEENLEILLEVYSRHAKTYGSFNVLDDAAIEKLARNAALVVETTKLSGFERAVLTAFREAASELTVVAGMSFHSHFLGYVGTGMVMVEQTSVTIDRDEVYWVDNFDGWLKMGSRLAEEIVNARHPKTEPSKPRNEEHRRELWWHLQRHLWEFAAAGLREIARSHAVGLEESVRIAAAQEIDQLRYLRDVKHRKDLCLTTINSLRATVAKLDDWLANTVGEDEVVSLNKERKRNVLPEGWDDGIPAASTDYEAAGKLGLSDKRAG